MLIRKNKSVKVSTKIILLIILVSLIPFAFFTCFIYNNYMSSIEKSNIDSQVRFLEQADSLSLSNIWNIERVARDICLNKTVQNHIMSEKDLKTEVSEELLHIVDGFDKIEEIIIFTKNNRQYSMKNTQLNFDYIDFIVKFGELSNFDGKIQWLDNSKNIKSFENCVLAGTIMRDTAINKSNEEIATVYLIIDKKIFESVTNYKDEGIFCVCDSDGNVLSSSSKSMEKNIFNYSMDVYNKMYYHEESTFTAKTDTEGLVVIKHRSPFTGWYWLKIVDQKIFNKDIREILSTALFFILIIIIMIAFLYFVIISRIFSPFKKIVSAMKTVENHNFNVKLSEEGNDEFALVARSFNKMIDEIENLIKINVKEEQEKMEAELNSLYYQINPHFLYNTLGTMRFTALKNKQYETADLMLKLSKLFRNCLDNKNKILTLEEDLENIKAYTDLLNIRYENKIHFEFIIDDKALPIKIPGMFLQPIIENGVIHGICDFVDSDERIPTVTIEAKSIDNSLVISIKDNGKGMSEEKLKEILSFPSTSEKIGIKNVIKRLSLHYGDKFSYNIVSKENEYTIFTVILS